MNPDEIRQRAAALLKEAEDKGHLTELLTLYTGTITVVRTMYGPDSPQEAALAAAWKEHGTGTVRTVSDRRAALKGFLCSIIAEIDAGFLGSLGATLQGEILADLLRLARAALDQPGDGAKNVAAVLTAAAFEDTIRRLASLKGISQDGRDLSDVLSDLKSSSVIQGAQVSIALSGLPFRNRALHAQWDQVDRSAVESIFAFTQHLLLKHFGP